MALALDKVTFDCAETMRVARFWAEALGFDLDPGSEPDGALIRDPSGRSDEGGSFWTVMHDPEGNELCVLRGPEDGWNPG
jgi:hypothetical protein